MRRRPRLKIGPELTVEANRLADRWASEADETLIKETDKEILRAHVQHFQIPIGSNEFIKIAAKRVKELRLRGYPEAWIERDIQKLVEGL